MNDKFLRQLPAEDQAMSDILQSNAESIQVDPLFQTKLESQLKQTHVSKEPSKGLQSKIFPALGWAIVIIGAFLILNWAVRSLAPNLQPATDGTPGPDVPFKTEVQSGNICQGQLAVVHGFSVFLSNQDKNGFIELDEQKNIGELRSFAWSPDGSQLAIVGNTRGSGNLYLTDPAGNQLQPLLSNSELGYLMGVAWSYDGKQLLTWEIENNKRLYLLNKDGTGLTEIDLPLQFFETPQFAPDDESILFYGADASSDGLFRASIDGSQVRIISDLVEDESSFAWSPDGSRLAYIEMDRNLGEARLVVDGEGTKTVIATLPIPKGSGSSIPNSANLGWSPDGKSLVFEFGRYASGRGIYIANTDGSGMNKLTESAHTSAISEDSKCLAYINNNQVFVLDLANAVSSSASAPSPVLLAELPGGRGAGNFQLDKLEWTPRLVLAPDTQSQNVPVSTPTGTEYDWRGTKLFLSAPVPDAPAEASVYQLQPEQPASIESVLALAQRFGIQGEVYQAPGELPDTTNFMVTDGKQRLYVRSEKYFTYYADYVNYSTDMFSYKEPLGDKAQGYIDEFLRSHGFDFAYRVENTPQIVNSYYVVPLAPDGLPLRFDYMLPARLEIKLDRSGQVIFMQSNQINYQQVGTFGLRTAEDAWQKVLNDNGEPGIQESMRSGHMLEEYYWQRSYPENQPVTIYGRAMYYPPAAAGGMPFVSIGDYTATGNIAGMDALEENTLVKASGMFSTENGIRRFNVDSWEILDGLETSFMGTLRRAGENVILFADDHNQYPLPDVPPNVPVGIKSEQGELNVSGVFTQGQFEWSIIQYFPADSMRGGGGGGGSAGFYKLNLTGTPVPLPTVEEVTIQPTGEYIVQEGDTLSSIAEAYGTTVDELIQLNGLIDPTIFIGQSLLVTGGPEPSLVGQKIEGQRGIILVEIYRQADGSQQKVYHLLSTMSNQYNYFLLNGDSLEGLEKFHNRPVDIWGTIESAGGNSLMEVKVDRFEIPYPDLQFQILRGTQEQTTLEGQTVTLFTTTEGQTYVQYSLEGNVSDFIVGNPGDEVLVEAMAVPGETFGGYPTLRVYSSALAINPKNGQPMDMQVTADQPSVIDGPTPDEQFAEPPTATIEKVELVYYAPDPRYQIPGSATGPVYIQPVWRFYGHYSEGSEFEILIQALKDEFLLPEVETVEPPG